MKKKHINRYLFLAATSISKYGVFIAALALLLTVALWVPQSMTLESYGRVHYHANLLNQVAPRAMMGTLRHLLKLSQEAFILMLVMVKWYWILTILWLLKAKPREQTLRNTLHAAAATLPVILIFCFNTPLYTSNALAGFVDIAASLLALLSLLCVDAEDDRRPHFLFTVMAWISGMLAVLVHEKALLEIIMVALWLTWKRGMKTGAVYTLGIVPASILFLYHFRGVVTSGNAPAFYTDLLIGKNFSAFYDAFDVPAILLGGGALWVLGIWAVWLIWRKERGMRATLFLLAAIAMLALCLAPLLVAHDTSRLVGVIWLPVLLFLRELQFCDRLLRCRAMLIAVTAIAVMQLLLPPFFIYVHGAVPLNCYARQTLEKLGVSHDPKAQSGFRPFDFFHRRNRPDIETVKSCLPVHLTR